LHTGDVVKYESRDGVVITPSAHNNRINPVFSVVVLFGNELRTISQGRRPGLEKTGKKKSKEEMTNILKSLK